MFNLIKAATKEQWVDTVVWFLFTLIGGLFPLWIGAILLRVTSSWRGWDFFVINGEFALYSASIIAPTIHILIKDTKKPWFRLLILISILVLMTSTALYTTVAVKTNANSQHEINEQSGENVIEKDVLQENQIQTNTNELIPIDLGALKLITLWLFIITLIIAFFATLLENVKAQPNVEAMKAREMKSLKEAFTNLSREGN